MIVHGWFSDSGQPVNWIAADILRVKDDFGRLLGTFLLGANSYGLHLPRGLPAKQFWSVTIYVRPVRLGEND